jgi:hypothetical protein
MYIRESKIGKQVLAWALVFTLTLSVIPYSSADGETEEWFEDWYYDFEDRDEDNNSDLITIHVDPDTDSANEVEVYISWDVYNNTGEYIYGDGEYFDINANETEYFGFEWGLEDCYYEEDACNAGPYSVNFTLYDDEWYAEDYFSISNITLSEMGMPDDVIQVDGGPLAWDMDDLHNDAVARALVLDYEVANVSYELEKKVLGVWVDAGNATTGDDGFAVIYNQTDGEYRWTAYYENEEIDDGWFLLQANSASNIGHVGYFYDLDDADDFDDFAFSVEEDNETNALSYVEIFYEDNNTLYKSGSAEDSGDDEAEIMFYDVPEGNYTFELYYEEDGDLLQTGWLHSYGSETDHIDYWFEDHNYTLEDSNNDGENNNVTINYEIGTDSQEEEEVIVEININSGDESGDYYSYEYEITANQTNAFETDTLTVEKDGNYTFEVWLYEGDSWNYYDYFNFEVYLECDANFTECDSDEWFEDSSYETEDTDGDNLDDTIDIYYDPNTECDCELDVSVYMDVYENSSGDWIDYKYEGYTINGTEVEYFEQSWTAHNSSSYDFYVYLTDDNGNWEDSFWLRNVNLYQTSGTGGPGDEDEYFDYADAYTYDSDNDGYDDTVEVDYDPDTTCDCNITVELVFDVYDNTTGSWINGTKENYTIYNDDDDYLWNEWSPEYNGTFDFYLDLYDEDGNLEDELEYLGVDLYVRSNGGDGDGDGDGDSNGVGHMGAIDNFDDDDYVNDYIGGVLEYGEYKTDAYFEIYDEDNNLVDSGNPNYYGMIFVSSNLTEGWYYQDVYYEENGDMLQTGTFYSYGNSSDFTVINVDNAVVDDDEYAVYDDVTFLAHQGTFDDGVDDVEIEITKYNETSGDWEYHAEVETNETGEAWLYNETCGTYQWTSNAPDNGEDDSGYYLVRAHCDDGNGGGDNETDYDEYFYSWEPVVNSDTISIYHDPDTECQCNVTIYVYVDVFENETGNYIDSIMSEYDIYNGNGDNFEEQWTANEDGNYDFNVYMYDEGWNFEDEFWIYDVYLSSDDGGGGNQTDDDNGVGHIGAIDNFDDDDYVNDYIGGVLEGEEYKSDAYFEIYDMNGNLIDSGSPNYYDFLFISSNLTEGWYYQEVYYQEDDAMLQTGPFYSYGNSTEFEVINVDNIVIDDDEYAVYDDVGFNAHQGNFDNGVANVGIEINKYNHSTDEWDYHAYVETNETGEAWLYNELCGEYEWVASTDDERGYYEVWAHCDDDGNGGDDNETKDYDEWFGYWDYYGIYDENDEHEWNELIIGYDPNTECNCTVSIYVEIHVWDENDDMVDFRHNQYNITDTHSDWFEQEYEFDNPGKYTFTVDIYDAEWNHEDSFEFTLIMSDESFESDFHLENATVYIDLAPHTNYEGEILTNYYLDVYRLNENDEWDIWDNQQVYEVFITGSNNTEYIHFEWTAEEDGMYLFEVWMEDEYWNREDWANFEAQIDINSAPVIEELINEDYLYEGQMSKYEVFIMDANADLQIHWDMGDGTTYDNGGFDLFHVYEDDGNYEITITVDDGTYNSIEIFEIKVFNSNPVLVDVMFDNSGNEGDTVSFNAQVSDVPSDEVTVTWTFPDGTTVESLFSQYTFTDDGNFVVLVTASDEDGGQVSEQISVTIENVAPIFTEFQMPSSGQEGEALDFNVAASDPGDDTVIFNIDFGDGTSPLITQDGGNISHKFAEGDTFTIKICATDEDGGETCREQVLPVSILEQLEDSGLPGFNLLAVISALGIISILRRRTH